MMRPHLAATMYCWTARVIRNAPFKWTFMTVSQSASDILNSRLSRVTPALLTSTVGSPSSATTFSTAALTWSLSETSAPTAIALPPACSISPTVRAPSSSLRSSTATDIPSSARRLAVPAPMPRAAPVTIAIRCGITFAFPSSARRAVAERRCSCDIIPNARAGGTAARDKDGPRNQAGLPSSLQLFYNSLMSSITVASGAGQAAGRFGGYGGRYVPESLIPACQAVADAFAQAWADPGFRGSLTRLLSAYAGRPTPLTQALRLSAELGVTVLLKRED